MTKNLVTETLPSREHMKPIGILTHHQNYYSSPLRFYIFVASVSCGLVPSVEKSKNQSRNIFLMHSSRDGPCCRPCQNIIDSAFHINKEQSVQIFSVQPMVVQRKSITVRAASFKSKPKKHRCVLTHKRQSAFSNQTYESYVDVVRSHGCLYSLCSLYYFIKQESHLRRQMYHCC